MTEIFKTFKYVDLEYIFKKNSTNNLFLTLVWQIRFFLLKKCVGHINSIIEDKKISFKNIKKKYINSRLPKYTDKKFKFKKKVDPIKSGCNSASKASSCDSSNNNGFKKVKVLSITKKINGHPKHKFY